MRKSFRMFFALALMVMGVVSVNAQERISLQEVGFHTWDGWDGNAAKTGDAGCVWGVGTSTKDVYGDMSVINYADVTLYSKLILTVTEGTPRVLFNRLKDEGQAGETFEESFLVDIPNKAWCTNKYQSVEGNVYTYDLKAIAKDYGFVHLHAIKGANWATVTVESAELETSGKATQVGWTEITTNGDLEGDDMSSFVAKIAPSAEILPAPVVEGAGVDGSKGIMIAAPAKVVDPWDSQFWIVLPQPLPEGTKFRVFFDAKANTEVTPETQAHSTPSNYLWWQMLNPNPAITTEWQSFKYEGVISAEQAGGGTFQSIAFNLSMDTDVEYYFDNIRFEEYKYGVSATFDMDVIELDFGFDTNLPALVKACGKPRLMYPSECVSVKVNDEEVEVMTVEGFADGRFYVFLEEPADDDADITLTFSNPTDEAYHLVYDGGPGGDVKDFNGAVAYNSDANDPEDAYSYLFVTPTIMSADPENGSFNLPNNLSEFKLTFDKVVDCAALVAKLGKESLTVEPAEGFAESVTLKRTDTGDLATGEYVVNITKIYPEWRIDDELFGDTTFVINVGKVNLDPADTLRHVLPDYFAATNSGGIPEGWYMVYDGTQREPGSSHGSGANMKSFGNGGDFTRGFYTRTNNDTPDQCIVEYGSLEGYALTLEAGKKYKVSYNLAGWAGSTFVKFEIYNPNGEVVYSRVDATKGDVKSIANSDQVASGSNYIEDTFYPETSGNFKVRWTPCNTEGNLVPGGMNEICLANPKVVYMPNAAGVEETQNLIKALDAAKAILNVCKSNENYASEALTTLDALVSKYEAEYETYTNPSSYAKAIEALNAAAKVMSDHRALCDAYYKMPEQLKKLVEDNAEKKFAYTELYAELKELVAKYVTEVETTEKVTDPVTGETKDSVIITVVYKKIVDDAELQAAIDELQAPVNTAAKLFTEGASVMSTTGVAALVERIRLGVEALKSLGVAESDPLIVAANNAVTDDDDLVEQIKSRLKLELYGNLKDSDKLFQPAIDTTTLEEVVPVYDMTVFVKNPNIYKLYEGINFNYVDKETSDTLASVPGWIVPEGANVPGLSWGWGDPGYAISDCSFSTWGPSYAAEQTIADLPVGIYSVKAAYRERLADASTEGSFFYVKTSDTPEGEYADTIQAVYMDNGSGYDFFPDLNVETHQQITVTDGMLTIGVVAGQDSHTFFNYVRIEMVGAAKDFNYEEVYKEIADGIGENVAAPAQVLGIELYDLNGRRIMKAQQGIVILKKYMSDGTIRVEKVIKK